MTNCAGTVIQWNSENLPKPQGQYLFSGIRIAGTATSVLTVFQFPDESPGATGQSFFHVACYLSPNTQARHHLPVIFAIAGGSLGFTQPRPYWGLCD